MASPGPIAAATSAGVDPSGISFTEPSGSAILNILVIARAHVASADSLSTGRVALRARLKATTVLSQFMEGPMSLRLPGSLVALILIMAALLFGAAGTFDYWQAWLFLVVLFCGIARCFDLARAE